MLRNALLTVGAALILSGAMAALAGHYPGAIVMAVWGAILVVAIAYERYGYKTILDRLPPGKGWTRTPERFLDEKSGRVITVYVKPLTGERAYVAEALAEAPPVV